MAEVRGIDVSEHQGNVDFVSVRRHGRYFVAIKVSEGKDYIDPSFGSPSDSAEKRVANLKLRMAAAEDAGLIVFPYHFAREDLRSTEAGARIEADFFDSVLNRIGWAAARPVCLDFEKGPGKQAWAEAFATQIDAKRGRGVLTYAGRFHYRGRAPQHGRMLWLPAYVKRVVFNAYAATMRAQGFTVKFWQYTDREPVTGVGPCDNNIYFGTLEELRAWAKAPTPVPPAATTPAATTTPRAAEPLVSAEAPSVADLQRALNRFTSSGRWVFGYRPVSVDGAYGPATARRVREVKYFLGYSGEEQTADTYPKDTPSTFLNRVLEPLSEKHAAAEEIATGKDRRIKQRVQWARQYLRALVVPGVRWFDGMPCAEWMIPILQWCRDNGWGGWLSSGHRTPAYSRALCMARCGKPRCPDCAGEGSRHSGAKAPNGAVDVTDHVTFARVMARCPIKPRIYNALATDRIHFSAFGN